MKSLVILALCFLTFQISDQTKAGGDMLKMYFKEHEDVKKKCLDEINVDDTLEKKFEDVAEINDDKMFKCFTKCLLIKSGAMSEAGVLIPENIRRNMHLKDVSVANDLVKQCSDYDKVDLCEGAKQLIDCGLIYLEKHG